MWAKMYILLGAERWNTRSKLVHSPREPPHHLSMLHSATSSSFTVCLEKWKVIIELTFRIHHTKHPSKSYEAKIQNMAFCQNPCFEVS
jgi:hypothetical protein